MQKSKVETINFNSEVLSKEMAIKVYLPKEYEDIETLPVLYFLHGRSQNENIMEEMDIRIKADKLIEKGEIEPLIIVCPRIDNSHGVNSSFSYKELLEPGDSGRIMNLGRYEDYFIKEVVPFIDKTFNTIKDRRGRYIGGISAGGYAALHNAFRHQNMFSKVGGHMPALELRLEEEDKAYYSDENVWNKYNPIYIASNNDIFNMKVYLDAGDKDEGEFYKGCSILYKILEEKKVNCENYIFIGNHSGGYIKSNMEKYLKFYNEER
ncbi:alpha/beta hydrolase [Clostridium felsineum]|uniref:alpha/beta hydrolase n=1 Tax=Clostridium felsineum TaxID=36839 RepID=UPI00098C519E|nr:alpha/beta hydrolase-fold protein [Clostridium felsineum]URZ18395.1 hypothetical protein CLFE_044650 [Clostridium felsineum DSM 794]